MDFNRLPLTIQADGGFLPKSVKTARAAYEKAVKAAADARTAEDAAETALAAAKEADKYRALDADFGAVEDAEAGLKRAGWARERARQRASDAFVALLEAVEQAKGKAIPEILAGIEQQRTIVEEHLAAVREAIAPVIAAKGDRDFLVRPNKRSPGRAMTDDERAAQGPLALPDGYRALLDAIAGVLDPPPAPTVAAQMRVWDPSRGRTMADVRRDQGLPLQPGPGAVDLRDFTPSAQDDDGAQGEAAA